MKVVYTHTGMNLGESLYSIIPMGAVSIVNELVRAGHDVRGINTALEQSLGDQGRNIADYLETENADLVLIDLHWYVHAGGCAQLAKLVRTLSADTFICVGGLTATQFAVELMSLVPAIDAVILGEGEVPVAALARELERGAKRDLSRVPNFACRAAGKVAFSTCGWGASQEEFDNFDFITMDWLHHEMEYRRTDIEAYSEAFYQRRWLEVARGCSFGCSMCGGGRNTFKKFFGLPRPRFRSAGSVARDLRRLDGLGYEQVAFSHDIWGLDYQGQAELMEELSARPVEMGLFHEFWRLPDPVMLAKLRRCFDIEKSQWSFSAETGNEAVRRRNFPSKCFGNKELLTLLHDDVADVQVEVYFVANLPFETSETWADTLALTQQVIDTVPAEMLRLYCGFLTIDPNSPMWITPRKFGIVREFDSLRSYLEMCLKGKRVPGYTSLSMTAWEMATNIASWKTLVESERSRLSADRACGLLNQ